MNEHLEQLVGYIKHHLAQGFAEADIRKTLIEHHWLMPVVDQAFEIAKDPPGFAQPEDHFASAEQPQPDHSQHALSGERVIHADAGQPAKYAVVAAVADMFKAIKKSPGAFVFSILISAAIAVVSLATLSLVFGLMVVASGGSSLLQPEPSLAAALWLVAGVTVLAVGWYVFVYSFVLAVMSLVLNNSIHQGKASLGVALSESFKRLGRVMGANVLYVAVSLLPVILFFFVAYALFMSGPSVGRLIALAPMLGLVSFAWLVITTLYFSLTPYVALFEPETPVLRTLKRSSQLLARGGKWFLVKGMLLQMTVIVVVALLSGQSVREFYDSNSPFVTFFFLVLLVIANGVLVMLYRNRKAVKS